MVIRAALITALLCLSACGGGGDVATTGQQPAVAPVNASDAAIHRVPCYKDGLLTECQL